ncbi:hypothetical protein O181_019811 [Austropuccinia psidii MF-1]|uniref:Uncharacterized protein n=1 Tax=Austropuccinia psidii MF-1 TaxID=1389203 RepID=A0A9Q3CCC1_9BASI|nr:hypothetical protein [Austropuccinia psidii MF-1]
MANYQRETSSPLNPLKPNFHFYPPGITSGDPWLFSTSNNQKSNKWCYTPSFIFFQKQSNGPNIKWLFEIFIRSSRNVIQEINQGSRASVKAQIPMTPSRNHWLFSFTVFLQANTGSSFSRDIQEAVPKQPVKGQCSINLPWQPHSFNTVWIHQDLYFIQLSSFPNLARYTLHQAIKYRFKDSIQTSSAKIPIHFMEIDRRQNFRFSEWAPGSGTPDSGDTDSEGTETPILGICSSELHNEFFSEVMKTYAKHKQCGILLQLLK